MKIDIIIVDLALVALVVAPYVLFIILGHREGTRLKNIFKAECLNNSLSIDEKDSWNANIIGLDLSKNILLLVHKTKTDVNLDLVNLREIKGCEVIREVQTIGINKRTEDILQRIDLKFTCYNDTIRIVNLYNSEETYAQEYELQHAEKWQEKIKALISYHPTINSAA